MNIKNRSWYPWLVVALLWVVALLNYLDRQMVSTMRPGMMADIQELAKAENFGRLMAIFLWIYALMSPLAGLTADRINRKWLIVGSLFIWSAVTLAMGYATSFSQLYTLRAFMGISEALYIPAGLSLIAEYHTGRRRSLAIGIHMSGIYVGQAMGGFGAVLSNIWSWHNAFFFFGLIGVLYSVVLVLFLSEKREKRARDERQHSFAEGFRSIGGSLSLLLGTITFWVILFWFAAPSFPGWAIKNWLPTLFSETLGIAMEKAGPLSTITTAASSFVGVIAGGIIADRWMIRNLRGRIFTGAIGMSLTIPALLLAGFSTGLTGIMSGAILFGIGFGMFDTNNMPILCQFVSPRHRAAGYGLMNMTGIFAGALVTGWLGKSTDMGSLGNDLALLAIPVPVAIVLLLATLRPDVADKTETLTQ